MKRSFILVLAAFLFIGAFQTFSEDWSLLKSGDYTRITNSIVRDLDGDGIDEVIISQFAKKEGKFVEIHKIENDKIVMLDKIPAPDYAIFFDVGDLDNNGTADILFLTSEGVYYRPLNLTATKTHSTLKKIDYIKSEIVVTQPEILTSVDMIIDLDGDKKNELVFANIRNIEIYKTDNFTLIDKIPINTFLEFALIPGQFYPHYIYYTLPIILVTDIDNDNKKEIIAKFQRSINVFSCVNKSWKLKLKVDMAKDNLYFLSNSFVKFTFPIITDMDGDNIKEIVVSSANLDMPRIRFEAIGDLYFMDKGNFSINKNKQIVIKGIPINLPYFLNIGDDKYKDFIIPSIPFNLISIFQLLSGGGEINVPFTFYEQTEERFENRKGRKLFDIPFRIENMMSFIEELPFDQYKDGFYPDFYYFLHDKKNKTVDILYYTYVDSRSRYISEVIKNFDIPGYRSDLPANLKLGRFSKNQKKDVLFIIHKTFYILKRD
ncbi:MAG TPA: VCBS repeat-containing protein [Spirochaetota bacterium]|jgi:hypothetical protein|nr:MAG: FG-GAP repeat protein [Spirochaetes bacterium ADurb.Bin133]HNZ27064.1 VCBS repeat-containing protein [Spirochaetota bacterium]HPY86434.1 VCBS repeat-containing protein [Spirochaetota bacterium]HQB62134.1 VCBS repeat-containing protein [Spirochaetota bacterium]